MKQLSYIIFLATILFSCNSKLPVDNVQVPQKLKDQNETNEHIGFLIPDEKYRNFFNKDIDAYTSYLEVNVNIKNHVICFTKN